MSGRSLALVAAAVALQAGLSVHAMRGHSATFDEGAHLPAGYTHLALGDHRLNPEQPPLVKLLAAAPLLAVRPVLKTDARSWAAARQWEFGQSFLYRWNDADRLLFLGRLPIVALASCLLVAVFAVALRLFGWGAAAAALSLAALSPDVLAHGGLVTTDLAFALFFFLSVVTFARALDEATPFRLVAAGLATGAAFATKFSAPILVPVFLLLGLLARRPRRLATALAVTGALAVLVVWASYGFRPALSPDPVVRAVLRAPLEAPVSGLLPRGVVAAGNAGLVPEDYARGLLFVLTHSEARRTFLRGEISDHGFPHYFLVTFLVKTPVPLLLLVALAVARIPRIERRHALVLWVARPRLRSRRRPRAACRSATGTCCPSTRSCSWPRARRRPGSGRGAARLGSSSPRPSPSGTRAAPCATTRTTSPTSTRSRAARRTAGGGSWTRTSTGART